MPIVDQMRKSNGDPFEEDPLPKAFYYPSQQKDLSERERKTCLSPEPKEKEQITSPADRQFLHQSNNFRIHETPTRENGTAADESSSTHFNESWPSTERTTMASTPETVADSTSETVRLSEIQGWPESSDIPLPNSTLARYIHRFRHSAPSSRQARDRVYLDKGKEGEFWWISSPDSSSTPRQSTPSEGQVPPHSPTVQKRSTRAREGIMSPPLTPLTRKLSGGSSTVASSVEGMDTPTKHLQKKAKELIDKSESTLDFTTSSNSSQPLDRGPSRKTEKDRLSSKKQVVERHTRSHHVRHQCSPPPPPEEDILYQWRLARKMEKARGRAVQGGSACNSASLRPLLPTSFQLGRPSRSRQIPEAVTSGPSSHPSVTIDHTPLMTSAVSGITRTPVEVPTVTGVTPGMVVTDVTPVVVPTETSISAAGRTPTQHVTKTLSTPVPGTIQRPDGIPGGDMCTVAGGVSPGTSRAAPTQLSTATSMASMTSSTTATHVSATPLVGSVGLHGIEQRSHRSCSHVSPKTLDIPSHMHLSCDILPCPHDMCTCVSQQTQYGHPVVCGCPVELPVVCPVLTHEHSASAGPPVAKGQTTESMKDIRVKSKQFKQEQGSHKRDTSGSEIKNKTRCKTKPRHGTPIDGSHIEDTDSLEDYKRKNKHVTQSESPLEGGIKPSSRRVVGGRVGNVIGQVVSERLFSTPMSSINPSEASSPAGSTDEDFGLNEVGEECSDEDFSDDEIVRVLREKMRRYRQELRQIDELLSIQPTR